MQRRRHALASAALASALATATMLASTDASALKNMFMSSTMKNLETYSSAGNMFATTKILGVVRLMGPREYAGWGPAVDKATAAAKSGNVPALKASCNGCHSQYRESYRNKYGSKSDGKASTSVP